MAVIREHVLAAVVASVLLGCGANASTDDEGSGGSAAGNGTGSTGGSGAGGGGGSGGGIDFDASGPDGQTTDSGCVASATLSPAGAEAKLSADYAQHYSAFLLGPVPGLPTDGHLGGCTISASDPDTLLVVGNSESPTGGLWSIGVVRDACGHIVAWKGTAQKLADAPYMDANLPYTDKGVLLYSMWPVNKLGQLLPGATSPSSETDLSTVGVFDSPGGLAFVPSYLPAAGELRAVGWPAGSFVHLEYKVQSPLLSITSASQTTTVTEGGGFAYVPPGSPGFSKASLIMAEWGGDAVVTYEVSDAGDPIPASRKPFFDAFPKPWGAYFEPVTGDFIFLTWTAVPDQVYIVQGFSKPPPPPPPPR
ncbi:MAG: hypothetical protein R3B13_26260 [Polyangiaceae bacterium]